MICGKFTSDAIFCNPLPSKCSRPMAGISCWHSHEKLATKFMTGTGLHTSSFIVYGSQRLDKKKAYVAAVATAEIEMILKLLYVYKNYL